MNWYIKKHFMKKKNTKVSLLSKNTNTCNIRIGGGAVNDSSVTSSVEAGIGPTSTRKVAFGEKNVGGVFLVTAVGGTALWGMAPSQTTSHPL